MTARKKEEPEGAEIPFEEGMKRLEKIVALLEREEIPLEEAIRVYEEGMKLHGRLAKVLEEAKLRIERLESGGKDAADED